MVKNMGKVVSKNSTHASSFTNLRYERKFIFRNICLEDLINTVVLTNSFCFEEVFTKRSVNNIYFDDNNFSFYNQNVAGDGERKKYRLRWYNDIFSMIKSPTLEIKKKFGEVGDKVSFKIKNFETDMSLLNTDQIYSQILCAIKKTNNKKLTSEIYNLFPALYNTYERRYFLSYCEKFRITLDFNMNFFNPNSYNNFYSMDNKVDDIVLELKYGKEHDNESRILTQQLNTRLTKNSKYVRGIDIINT